MARKKAGTVFADFTAAYDTVWHCCLTCKLLHLLPDRHTVKMFMELVTNHSFTLTTRSGTHSRLRRLKNGIPQGSVLASLLYNLYTYNLPTSVSQKYAHADDLTIMHSARDWQAIIGVLSQDLVTLAAYFQTWWLKLSWSKTVSVAFHLNNREAGHKLNVSFDGKCLSSQIPTHLGVKLDRSLTYHRHLESLRGNYPHA